MMIMDHDVAPPPPPPTPPADSEPGTALIAAPPAGIAALPRNERTLLGDRDTLRLAIDRTLDAVDEIADAVAESLGLRER
jgi:hypothetical protein